MILLYTDTQILFCFVKKAQNRSEIHSLCTIFNDFFIDNVHYIFFFYHYGFVLFHIRSGFYDKNSVCDFFFLDLGNRTRFFFAFFFFFFFCFVFFVFFFVFFLFVFCLKPENHHHHLIILSSHQHGYP